MGAPGTLTLIQHCMSTMLQFKNEHEAKVN